MSVTVPKRVAPAAQVRETFQAPRGEPVAIDAEVGARALSDCDAALGVKFEVA